MILADALSWKGRMDQIPADKLAVQIDYWKQGAASDLESAEDIVLNTKRYAAGLFFLHLALEKILKALYVHKQSQYAPITHNLVSLVFKCGLTVEKQQEESLVAFNEFNILLAFVFGILYKNCFLHFAIILPYNAAHKRLPMELFTGRRCRIVLTQ